MGEGMRVNVGIVIGTLIGVPVALMLVNLFSSGMMGGGVLGMLIGFWFWVAIVALIALFVVWIAGQSRRRWVLQISSWRERINGDEGLRYRRGYEYAFR